MPDNDTSLPPGFVIQTPASSSGSGISTSGLPPGFVIQNGNTPPPPTPAVAPPPPGFVIQNSPNNGQSVSDAGAPEEEKPAYQDSSQPWYTRAFSWLNTPLTESLFGIPETRQGAGGIERGIERIASGLTSPLSLGLTAATLGPGGFIESAGTTALKESGEFAAEELPQIIKAAQIAVKSVKDQKSIEPVIADALEAGGHDMGLLDRARKILAPLNRDAELAEPEIQSGLSKIGLNETQRTALAKGEMSAAEREAIATQKGGFSNDELKALADTGRTVKEAEKGFTPVDDALREANLDPSLWKRARDVLSRERLTENDLLSGNMVERGAFQVLRHVVPDLPVAVTVRAAKTANTLLNAGFTLQQLESASAMSPRFLDALKEGDYDKAEEYGTEMFASGALGVLGASHALHSAGELASPLLEPNKRLLPSDEWLAMERANKEREVVHATGDQMAINLDNRVRDILGHTEPGFLEKVFGGTEESKNRKNLELATVFHQIVTGGDKVKAANWYNALSEALGRDDRLPVPGESGPNNGLFSRQDPELAHQIETNVFKKQPKDYQDLVLESLRRVASGSLSDREQRASEMLRNEQDRNYEIGSSNDLLHHYLEDYMTRVYKDTNPAGRVILSDAKGGRFATNVSMAKQRVYDSNLTALLKSPKQMLLDPVQVTARGRASLIKAAANRQLIDTLRDKFTRASDGRPAVVLSGSGQVVSGQNGEDPKTFIDPNRVRKINIDPKVVEQLTASGELQRFLDQGTIRDITPYVHPQNIGAAIDRLDGQAGRQNAQYDEVGNNKLRTQIMLLKSMQANGDFRGLKEFNDGLEKNYAWDPQDYISLANNAMKGWNFITNSPDGSPIFVRSDIRVHPEFAEYLKNRLGLEPSDIAKHPVGKALLGVGTRAKETLLSLSPFHTVQIALRGLMTGINPFTLNGPDIIDGAKVDPADPNSPTKLRKMVEHGYTTGTDYKALQEHSEGLSGGYGLLRKIPGVGSVLANSLDFYNNFLFKRFIPAVKATAAEHLFDEYRAAHPDWSVDRVAKAAALHSNENFGGINWRAMGRSATTQDWGRLLTLAPDWLESELRAGARLFNKDEGGVGRRQIAIMTMSLWGIARVLNLMNTGNAHYEAPFGLATRTKEGKEIIYGVRTLPQDLLYAATDPVAFLKGRLSPTIRTGTELVTGRDQFGRKLAPTDLWADVTRNLLPIPVQSIGQAITSTGPQVGSTGQIVKAMGGTAQTYATPAQKLAADMAADHTESGPIDPAQMARHRTIMEFEDKIRAGEMSLPDIYRMYAAGELHEDDLKKVTTNIKDTKDLDPGMASLYSRASRLPGPEYLKLYDEMNNSEKAALSKLTLQVRKRYIAKAMKDLRPDERLKDPTFMRFLNMVTDQSPF
jgi:hypothetical protein